MPWIYVINDFNVKEIVGTFYGKEWQKKKQIKKKKKKNRIEKVIKRKGDQLYVK